MLDGGSFDFEAVRVALHEGVETVDIGRVRRDAVGLLPGEDLVVQEVVERFVFSTVRHVGAEQRNAPCAAFAGILHHRHRDVDGRRHDLLADFTRLEEAAVAEDLIDLHGLLLEQDVQPGTHRAQRGVKLDAHEIGEVEVAVRRAHEHRAPLFEVRHVLARQIAVGEQAAGVRVARQRQVE